MRLYRPHIPLSVRCQVAERQITSRIPDGLTGIDEAIAWLEGMTGPVRYADRLRILLKGLSGIFGCEVSDLRLDHDPALAAREKVHDWITGKHTGYIPDANSPDHLNYRPHGPQFENSHLIKTNVRGDHGQHPDRVLIKKNRRIERGPKPRRGPKMQSRGFEGKSRPFPKRRKD